MIPSFSQLYSQFKNDDTEGEMAFFKTEAKCELVILTLVWNK